MRGLAVIGMHHVARWRMRLMCADFGDTTSRLPERGLGYDRRDRNRKTRQNDKHGKNEPFHHAEIDDRSCEAGQLTKASSGWQNRPFRVTPRPMLLGRACNRP